MNRSMCSLQNKMIAAWIAALGIVIFGPLLARAQSWEGLYGGAGLEAGFGGVTPVVNTPGGGFIAAGQSNSPGGTGLDVYVVKTNNLGATVWSATYDLSGPGPFGAGGDDFANDIKELPNGDFILTGYTYNRNTLYNDSIHGEIFLMRIDANGATQWTKTFGGIDPDTGVSVYPAANGDFIVAGSTLSFGAAVTSNSPPALGEIPDRDAFILRADPMGNLLWMRTYGGEYFDAFRSVIELTSGEIVAAGYSESFVLPRRTRPFVVRVDPAGLIGTLGYVTNAVVIRPNSNIGTYLNCIRKSPTNNTFVAVGTSGTGVRDVYVMALNQNLVGGAEFVIGQAGQPEDGMWLDFDRYDPPGPAGPTYDPVIAATRANAAGVPDVWGFQLNAAGVLVWSMTYGFGLADYGHSISYVPQGASGTPGFIIAGQNWGTGPLPAPQLYMIRTNRFGVTGCTDVSVAAPVASNSIFPQEVHPRSYRVRVECTAQGAQTFAVSDDGLICPPLPKSVADPAEALTNAGAVPGTDEAAGIAALRIYPNPIAKEKGFTVGYRLLQRGETTIIVNDLSGKEIYRLIDNQPEGEVSREISVRGWGAGTYIVTVRTGEGSSVSEKITVGTK